MSEVDPAVKILIPSNILLLLGLSTIAGAAPAIQNYSEADLVLGQPDFGTQASFSPPTASSLNRPTSVAVDPVTRKVFVCDSSNSRVLRFGNADALKNGAAAEVVFGQQLFTSRESDDRSDRTVGNSESIFFDYKGRLWVTDGYDRILMFNAASFRNSGEAADRVFGRPDFTSYRDMVSYSATGNVTRSSFDSPTDLCVDASDRLWVADTGNNRVLRFDAITSKANGAMADGVLGQVNFTTGRSRSGVSASSSTIGSPTGVSVSGNGSLYVTARDENRVLRFDRAAALADGAVANAVFGQPDFVTTSWGGGNSVLFAEVSGACITADDSLWVTDTGANRLLRFTGASTKTNGVAADGVLGQPDFTKRLKNTTSRDLSDPSSKPFVDARGSVWVADKSNNRVLRFSPDLINPVIKIATKIPKISKQASLLISGTATDAGGIKSVQYRLGKGALKTASGTTSWSLKVILKKGRNVITLITTDNVGNVSLPTTVKIRR